MVDTSYEEKGVVHSGPSVSLIDINSMTISALWLAHAEIYANRSAVRGSCRVLLDVKNINKLTLGVLLSWMTQFNISHVSDRGLHRHRRDRGHHGNECVELKIEIIQQLVSIYTTYCRHLSVGILLRYVS